MKIVDNFYPKSLGLSNFLRTFAGMIELSTHIEYMLLSHDEVSVPQLGTFIVRDMSSKRIDEEGIFLPKSVTKGKIIKQVNEDGTKRYDFQFENTRGYKITVEGLSEKFNPEYWNYAKLISGVLRYRMPIEHVIKLVSSLSLQSENINTWKVGVERALKKYLPGGDDAGVALENSDE